ncbi:Crp/Fnr family transcriptional regulator [Candidatus Gottesmanbacteria bacterium]|nr:Crp/Fnr family transcriptional regulator [Candidatus Gottesmanbacteria bacterium]
MEQPVSKKSHDFFSSFPQLSIKRGRILIHPYDISNIIYFVETGFIRQYIISESDTEVTVNIFKPFSFFPMMGIITDLKNKYYFVAASDCRVRRAPGSQVLEFVKKNPDVLFDLLKRVYIGVDGLLTQLEQLMSADAEKRITTLLTLLGKRFGEKEEKVAGRLKIRFTHQQLASLTGLSRETVSRQMKKLERENFFKISSGYICLLPPSFRKKRILS